jgi:hypothetical protein
VNAGTGARNGCCGWWISLIRRQRVKCLAALLVGAWLMGVAAACSSDSPIAGRTYRGNIEISGPGTAIIEIHVSADGQSIGSLSLGYTTLVGWGPDKLSVTSSDTVDYLTYEPFSLQPGEVPIIDNQFSYSRDVLEGDPRRLAAVSGRFVSPSQATGSMSIVQSSEEDSKEVLEFEWSAVAD